MKKSLSLEIHGGSLIVYPQMAQSASSAALTALDAFDKIHERAHSE